MKPELVDLKISDRELEQLSGYKVGSSFVGGVLNGMCRPSVFQDRQRLFSFCLIEMTVLLLLLALMLPAGLLLSRNLMTNVAPGFVLTQFAAVTVGLAVAGWLAWNVGLWVRGKRLSGLMKLLDHVDRYHDVLGAIALLDDLESAMLPSIQRSRCVAVSSFSNRETVLEALHVTRAILIAGLMTERFVREQSKLDVCCQELQACIKTNLAQVQTFEVRLQADDYGQFLNEAWQIGFSVQQEMQKLLH